MKILHVLLSPRSEGTPRLVLDWLAVKEVDQEVLFLSPEGELRSQFEQTGVWQKYNTAFEVRAVEAMSIIRLVQQVCVERKPDIVISWIMSLSQWIHVGARRAGVHRLIAHAGNPPGTTFLSKYLFTYLTFWTGNIVGNRIVAVSEYIRRKFLEIPFVSMRQLVMVYNCFRVDRFLNSRTTRNPKQAIMVATLESHKDHTTLLKAWKIVEEKNQGLTLLLAGAGKMEDELKKLAAWLDLKSVTFLGSRSDIPALLNGSGIFILSTTDQEGFGTVLLEALASGCKVIASDVPACREVLRGGEYGRLAKPGDPGHLAACIIEAAQSDLDEATLNAQVRYAAQFTPQRMIESYI
ncbi:MAG TPA: glycosyltransferase, partial [Cyclobacteriaceae bacterium]|nr:glycosyltransferase [Cyclobacteriaceae bacterium]